MDQIGFCQRLLYLFEYFVSVLEPYTNSWFGVPTNQMPMFVIFVRAGVLFDGTFSLWVSLNSYTKLGLLSVLKKKINKFINSFQFSLKNEEVLLLINPNRKKKNKNH